MESVTFLIAALAGIIILCSRSLFGLIVYIITLVWYPSFLTISIGSIDFTLCRIVILVLYSKLFLQNKLSNSFKLITLDKALLIYFSAQIIAGINTIPIMQLIENRAGAFFDLVLPYFAIRIIVTNKRKYLILLKSILMISAPLALFGLYQCTTGNNPFGFLRQYHTWSEHVASTGYVVLARKGFYRADVTFRVSIMFGLYFAMLAPVCVGLIHNIKRNKYPCLLGFGLMGIGVLTSMSSSPLMALILALIFISCYRWRKYSKRLITAIIIMCLLLEILSNRHFYRVIDYVTFNEANTWYRARLIEISLFEGGMSGHWLTGFGFNDPGWGAIVGMQEHTDMVNHYLLVLSRFGLVGFVPFIIMNIAAIMRLVKAFKETILEPDRWMIWCLSASLFGLAFTFFSVSLFGQPTTIYYMVIGLSGIMPSIITRKKDIKNVLCAKIIL